MNTLNTSSAVDVYDYVIIGGGLSGLSALQVLKKRNITKFVLLEKQSSLGGCWANVANVATMTQTESSNYSFHVNLFEEQESKDKEILPNTLYTRAEIVQQAQSTYKDHPNIVLNANVNQITKDVTTNTYRIVYVDSLSNRSVTLTTRRVWFFPGTLHTPRRTTLNNEAEFKGHIYHTANMLTAEDYRSLRGKNVVIVGTGAFALENARNALENGAHHITILARTSRFVFPRAVGWAISANPGKPVTFDQILKCSSTMYQQMLNQRIEEQDWYFGDKQGFRMCSIAAISDLYFLAQKVGKLTVLENAEVDRLHERTISVKVRNVKENTVNTKDIEADVLIKSLGFNSDSTVPGVFASVGSTVQGYWVNGDKNFFFFHPPERVSPFLPLSLEMVSFSVLTYIQLVIQSASALDERPEEQSHATAELIKSFPAYELNKNGEGDSFSIPFPVTGAVLGASFGQPDIVPKLLHIVRNKSILANSRLPLPHTLQTLTKEWMDLQEKWGIKEEARVAYPFTPSDIEKFISQ